MKNEVLKLRLAPDAATESHAIKGFSEWTLLLKDKALVLTPIATLNAEGTFDETDQQARKDPSFPYRIPRQIPPFEEVCIYPISEPPDRTDEFPKETADLYAEHVAWAKKNVKEPLTSEQHRPSANEELLRRYGLPPGFPPEVTCEEQVVLHLGRRHEQADAVLLEARFRAEFRSGETVRRYLLSKCEPRPLTKKEQAAPSAITAAIAQNSSRRSRQVAHFNADFSVAVVPQPKGEPLGLTVEPELQKLVQRIITAGGRLPRTKLRKDKTDSYQPEKLLRSKVARKLVKAGLLGMTKTGRTTVFRAKHRAD